MRFVKPSLDNKLLLFNYQFKICYFYDKLLPLGFKKCDMIEWFELKLRLGKHFIVLMIFRLSLLRKTILIPEYEAFMCVYYS